MADLSVPERLGHALGRHQAIVKCGTGLALTVAALATLGLFLPDALAPARYESTAPLRHDDGSAAVTRPVCFRVTDDGMELARPGDPAVQCIEISEFDLGPGGLQEEVNRSERRLGRAGAVTSCAALAIGWRLWRPLWKQRQHAVHRGRAVLAATGLAPLAAILIFAAAGLFSWGLD